MQDWVYKFIKLYMVLLGGEYEKNRSNWSSIIITFLIYNKAMKFNPLFPNRKYGDGIIMLKGYVAVTAPKGYKGKTYFGKNYNKNAKRQRAYVYQHRLVMEKKIGRYLESDELVHHKNKIRHDNREENLEIVVGKGRHSGKIRCPYCLKEFRTL